MSKLDKTDYEFNPLVGAKHIRLIGKKSAVNSEGDAVIMVDVENIETGMIYCYDIPHDRFTDWEQSVKDRLHIPKRGWFGYAQEIETLGIRVLHEDGYHPKRLAIYAMLCGKDDMAKQIMQGKPLNI
jgi:hypothetical protein